MTDVVARFFPAQVLLPDRTLLRKAYVVLAQNGPEAGVWAFIRPDEVGFRGIVDWADTAVPAQRQARNGFDVRLVDGTTLTVTAGASCRCGSLGRWAGPSWARSVAVRA